MSSRKVTDGQKVTVTSDLDAGTILAGNPSVIEIVRIAESMAACPAELIVFVKDRAMVVGSLGDRVLQPRPLRSSEIQLRTGSGNGGRSSGHVVDGSGVSFAVLAPDRSIVGALSLGPDAVVADPDAFHGLCRLVSALLADAWAMPIDGSAELEPSTVLNNLRDGVLLVDASWTIIYANQASVTQLGWTPAELVGSNAIDLIHPDDVADAFEAMLRLANGDEVYRTAVRLRCPSGDHIRIEVTGRDRLNDPNVNALILSLRNGDGEQELEGRLEQTRRLSSAALEQLHDGIVVADATGALLVVNETARRLLDLAPDRLVVELSLADFEFRTADDQPLPREAQPLRQVIGGAVVEEYEVTMVSASGRRDVVVSGHPVVGSNGERMGAVLGLHDVTEARHAERELRQRALHDQLTGLPNRRQLHERLDEFGAEAKDLAAASSAPPVTCCLVDLDNFKIVNDTHGHRMGDTIIKAAAQRLSVDRAADDLLVRLGGDEFVVLSRSADVEAAMAMAEELRIALAEPFGVEGLVFHLSGSIGVAQFAPSELANDSLLRCADIALYAAKAQGRNRVVHYDDTLALAAAAATDQRDLLRRALDDDALEMHFQPVVDSLTGRIVGVESLARCVTSDGSVVGPAGFLDAVEGSGLVWELDRRAFEQSCRAAATLAAIRPDLTMACNFSALSILQQEFVDFVDATIAHHGLDPAMLSVEITESAAFDAGPVVLDALRRLSGLGVQLALDDFGTGYSSLAHLRDLPLTTVKVDRSFVTQLTSESSERSIANAIVGLARDLGLDVIAEGVETESQLEAAQSIGFTVIQGWYYAPASPLDEIVAML